MTINEMKDYLETLIEDGLGDNRMRTMITDSYGHNQYGVEARLNKSRTMTNNDMKHTGIYFSIEDSNCHTNYDASKNAITKPCITFRKQ
mgnify:CR=1 FL=1|jgi:hypothetical protein